MTNIAGLTYETSPLCPHCGKKPWRREHLVQVFLDTGTEEQDGQVTVCMHCAKIWVLCQSGNGAFSWRRPTRAERARILVEVNDIVRTFEKNIANAARMN